MLSHLGTSFIDPTRPSALSAPHGARRGGQSPSFNRLVGNQLAPSVDPDPRPAPLDKTFFGRSPSDRNLRTVADRDAVSKVGQHDDDEKYAIDDQSLTSDDDVGAFPASSPASPATRAGDAAATSPAADADTDIPGAQAIASADIGVTGQASLLPSAEDAITLADPGGTTAQEASATPPPLLSSASVPPDALTSSMAASFEVLPEATSGAFAAATPTGGGEAAEGVPVPASIQGVVSGAPGAVGAAPANSTPQTTQIDVSAPPPAQGDLTFVSMGATSDDETSSNDDQLSHRRNEQTDNSRLAAMGAPAAETTSAAAAGSAKSATPVRAVPEQIAIHMLRGARDGLSHLHIALEPDNLGHLDIRLDFHRDGRLAATIAADNPETLNLLRSEARSLEQSLNAAGFKADADSLSFDLNSANDRPSDQPGARSRLSSPSFGERNENFADAAIVVPAWRRLSPGRLDIRA